MVFFLEGLVLRYSKMFIKASFSKGTKSSTLFLCFVSGRSFRLLGFSFPGRWCCGGGRFPFSYKDFSLLRGGQGFYHRLHPQRGRR